MTDMDSPLRPDPLTGRLRPDYARAVEDASAALARLDAPMDWDTDSPEDRYERFGAEIRAALSSESSAPSGPEPPNSLLRELDGCQPRYEGGSPNPTNGGSTAFSGWYVPDWLMMRVRDALSRSSVSAQENPDDLGAAWKEAEAALPEGWDLSLLSLRKHIDPERDGPEIYAATAAAPTDDEHPYTRVISSEEGRPRGSKHDPTPAAALRSLALRLSGNLDQESGG